MATEKRLIFLDEAIAKIKDDGLLGFGYSDDERIGDVIDMLESCHIVDAVEVVHGQWFSLTDCSNAGVYCSVCHKKVWKEDYAWCNRKNKLRSNYCPNCGADMRGDGNG